MIRSGGEEAKASSCQPQEASPPNQRRARDRRSVRTLLELNGSVFAPLTAGALAGIG
jgi:hypothetical protein